MAKIRKIYDQTIKPDGTKVTIYPITSTRAVYTPEGKTLDSYLKDGYFHGADLAGYKVIYELSELPLEETPFGYLMDSNLYVWVGTRGDTLGGKYQNCGPFKGPKGDGYPPDEEDLTASNDLLKLKNRSTTYGMGYVILRRGATVAEQLTQENTIYEIRYSFDLDGGNITVPSNSTLVFNGGSFHNGKIIGQSTTIMGHSAVDCNLGGTFTDNRIEISWFVNSDNDLTITLTRIINYANERGDHVSVVFPNNDGMFTLSGALPEITCNHINFYGNGTRLFVLENQDTDAIFAFIGEYIKNGVLFEKFTFQCGTPNENVPVFLFANYASIRFSECSFVNTGQGIVMGTTSLPAYSLNINGTSAVLANIGKAFVTLVNGAGFTWNTHSGISHMQATVPSQGEEMNTVEGTNAVDIVGNWDSVDLDIFAEKLYRGINIVPAEGSLQRGAIYYVKVHDCIFDYIRDSAIYVNQQFDITNNFLIVTNNYVYTWEGPGMYFNSNASHINSARIENNLIYRADTWGMLMTAANTTYPGWVIRNNYSALNISISGIDSGSIVSDNKVDGSFVFSAYGTCEFSRNMAESYAYATNANVLYESNVIKGQTITPQIPTSGISTSRPSSSFENAGLIVGFQYFDETLGKPIYYAGSGTWVDATGTTV